MAAPAFARDEILWRNPGPVSKLDFQWGPGGRTKAPAPPFRFLKEDLSGSKAKVNVVDAHGRHWNVKFGYEVPGECFGPRVAWAAGYFVEPVYCLSSGRIVGVGKLSKRAQEFVDPQGRFVTKARFQLRDPSLKFLDEHNWSWTYNPFLGTRELSGLKIVIMLTSNWDNKDARDADEGINTAIFQRDHGSPRYIYAFTDWGQIMGGWGGTRSRSPWSCGEFMAETRDFVSVVDGKLRWGYVGRHRDFKNDITVQDVRWVMRYLGQIRDSQLRAGLLASGATTAEASCFTRELRRRLEMLRFIASGS